MVIKVTAMGAPRLETQAHAYWLAASAMRGRMTISRMIALRALGQIAKGPHAGLANRARAELNPPRPRVRLFDDWPPSATEWPTPDPNGGNAA